MPDNVELRKVYEAQRAAPLPALPKIQDIGDVEHEALADIRVDLAQIDGEVAGVAESQLSGRRPTADVAYLQKVSSQLHARLRELAKKETSIATREAVAEFSEMLATVDGTLEALAEASRSQR